MLRSATFVQSLLQERDQFFLPRIYIGQFCLPGRAARQVQFDAQNFAACVIGDQLFFRKFPPQQLKQEGGTHVQVLDFCLIANAEVVIKIR